MSTSQVLFVSGGTEQTTTANTTMYLPVGNVGLEAPGGAEALRHILYRTPGRISNLYVRITANSIAGRFHYYR